MKQRTLFTNGAALLLALMGMACGGGKDVGKDVGGTDGSAFYGRWYLAMGGDSVLLDISQGSMKVAKTCANGVTVKGDIRVHFEGNKVVADQSLDQSMTLNGAKCSLSVKQGQSTALSMSGDGNRLTMTEETGQSLNYVRVDLQGNPVVTTPNPQPVPTPVPGPAPTPSAAFNGAWEAVVFDQNGFLVVGRFELAGNSLTAISMCSYQGTATQASVTTKVNVSGNTLTMLESKSQDVNFGAGYNCSSSSKAGQTANLELMSGGSQLRVTDSASGQTIVFDRK